MIGARAFELPADAIRREPVQPVGDLLCGLWSSLPRTGRPWLAQRGLVSPAAFETEGQALEQRAAVGRQGPHRGKPRVHLLAAELLRERLREPMGERLREPMGEPMDADLLGAAEV